MAIQRRLSRSVQVPHHHPHCIRIHHIVVMFRVSCEEAVHSALEEERERSPKELMWVQEGTRLMCSIVLERDFALSPLGLSDSR